MFKLKRSLEISKDFGSLQLSPMSAHEVHLNGQKTTEDDTSPPYADDNNKVNTISGRLTNGIDPFTFAGEFLLQRYENLFKYCCICLVRKRRKTVSSCSGSAENYCSARYRVQYDPNTTSVIPVICYQMADAIKIK